MELLESGRELLAYVGGQCYDAFLTFVAWWFVLYMRTCRKLGWPLQIEEYLMRKTIEAPRPILRRRALSLPSHASSLFGKQRATKSQDQCGLFKLPVELRLQIYQEAMKGKNSKICMDLTQYIYRPLLAVWQGEYETIDDLLSLSMTCRQM